jgi:hypothetical protein
MKTNKDRLEIKGKYYPDRTMANPRDPPMFIHISSNNKSAVDSAFKLITEIIERGAAIIDRGGLTEGGMARFPGRSEPKGLLEEFDTKGGYNPANRLLMNSIEAKVPMPTEIHPNDYGTFKIRAKIVGPAGSFVKHIQSETNTRVIIRGQGSGYLEVASGAESEEPLHVFISGANQENVDRAKQFLSDLIETVLGEYREWKGSRSHILGEEAVPAQQQQLTGDPAQDYAMYYAWYKQYYDSIGYPDSDTVAAQFAAQAMAAQTATAGSVPPPPEDEIPPPPEDEIPPPPEDDMPPPPEDDMPPTPEDDMPPPPEDDMPPPPEDDMPPPPEEVEKKSPKQETSHLGAPEEGNTKRKRGASRAKSPEPEQPRKRARSAAPAVVEDFKGESEAKEERDAKEEVEAKEEAEAMEETEVTEESDIKAEIRALGALAKLTVPQLKEWIRKAGLSDHGLKKDLVARLEEYIE